MSNINNTTKMNQTDAKAIEQWISVQPKTLLEFVPSAKKRVFEQTKHNQIMNKTSTNISNLGVLPNEIISYVIEFLKNSLETFLAIRLCSSYFYKTTLNVCVVLFKSIQLENKEQYLSKTISEPVLEKTDNRLQTMHILTRFLVHDPQAIGLYHKEIAACWQWLNKCEPKRFDFLSKYEKNPNCTPFKSLPMRRVLFLYLYEIFPQMMIKNRPLILPLLKHMNTKNLFKPIEFKQGDLTSLTTLLLYQDQMIFQETTSSLKKLIKENTLSEAAAKTIFDKTVNLLPKSPLGIAADAISFFIFLIKQPQLIKKDWVTERLIDSLKALLVRENSYVFIPIFWALAQMDMLEKKWVTQDLFNKLVTPLFNEKLNLLAIKRQFTYHLGLFAEKDFIQKTWITQDLFEKFIPLLNPQNSTSQIVGNTLYIMEICALKQLVNKDWFTKDAFDNIVNSLQTSNDPLRILNFLNRLTNAGFIKRDWITHETRNKIASTATNRPGLITKATSIVLKKLDSL